MSRRDSRNRTSGNSSEKKYKFGRSRKRERKFYGEVDGTPASKRRRSSSSSRKLQDVTVEPSNIKYRIVDINILFPALEEFICCKQCHGKIKMTESGIQGLGFKINVSCTSCHEVSEIPSSKKVGKQNNAFEINRRSVLAMRALGQGQAGLSTFCGIMDFLKPVVHSVYDTINDQLKQVCEEVAQTSMTEAVQQEVAATPANSTGIDVSGDGSWRKRGFSSLQGVTSIIGNRTGKVIDVSIKNSYCQPCTKWESRKGTAEYQEWYEAHEPQCTSNHTGSAGKMEVDSIVEMFQRSEKKYGVKYQNYIGDGDSKVFKELSDVKPYGDALIVEKKECVGHVQKRMGTRLRNLKKTLGSQKLADGKSIGGRGRLTGQLIDQLSRYYGNAIRSNCDSAERMSKSIWATYFHKISTDENPQHHLCPEGNKSWCKWQKAKAQGNLTNFKHTNSIPSAVMEQLKPIYEDLTESSLLKRCVGGFTQNNNESFNNSVWKLTPKIMFSGLTVLQVGTYIAVTCFNDGRIGFLNIMKKFGIDPGKCAIEWVKTSDDQRLFEAEKKLSANTVEARRSRRRVRLQLPEESYQAGAH